jgi:hypothetical protein
MSAPASTATIPKALINFVAASLLETMNLESINVNGTRPVAETSVLKKEKKLEIRSYLLWLILVQNCTDTLRYVRYIP